MVEEKLLDHNISRLEAQLLDNVEVRHPQITSSLLQIIDNYEDRFLNRMTRGPSYELRNATHSANNQFTNRNRHENCWDTRVENRYHDTSRPQRESNRFGVQGVGDNRRFDSRRQNGQYDHRFNNHDDSQGGSRNDAFEDQNGQNRSINTKLGERQNEELQDLFNSFKGLFSDKPGLTHVLYREIKTRDQGSVVSRPYRYDRVKQGIINYHVQKMLNEGTIRPIQSPYVSPVVLTRKNNGLPPDSPEAYRFAIDYHKLNVITKYSRYPLPSIDDLITTNIPFTTIMSTLVLRSGYFQLAINPRDIEKTTFVTKNGTFAFNRMPFGLSRAAPNFQKAIDIILKPVLVHFVSVYMDDVIISSPSFTEHVDHLNQVFTLLQDAGLTMNKDKCHLARDKFKYLGLIISRDGIKTDDNKVPRPNEILIPS
ncbi:retrovirus-related Pol polyprotein from transposon 297 [Trichonephila clavipes]|uniref:Retrovirus-related Pol polyprotein from transposon 297 n=2 Tax=Trichonephila clavipes TaxID=2585209 RepID=A0A8X6SZN4_TRICX|nr:retrovirus-related Pol polyprotein from transposon 297 [Trichonephila clavipes]